MRCFFQLSLAKCTLCRQRHYMNSIFIISYENKALAMFAKKLFGACCYGCVIAQHCVNDWQQISLMDMDPWKNWPHTESIRLNWLEKYLSYLRQQDKPQCQILPKSVYGSFLANGWNVTIFSLSSSSNHDVDVRVITMVSSVNVLLPLISVCLTWLVIIAFVRRWMHFLFNSTLSIFQR